jgi:hypothetical protein
MTSEILLKRETIEREQPIELLAGKPEELFGADEAVLPPPAAAPHKHPNAPQNAAPSHCSAEVSPVTPPNETSARPPSGCSP